MYGLYGITIDYTPGYDEREPISVETKQLVATFDSIDLALNYVENSKLKKPIRHSYSNDEYYRRDSLLKGCGYYEIEKLSPPNVPHNPSY